MKCSHYWEPVYTDATPMVTYSTARVVDCLICRYCGTVLHGEQVKADYRRILDQRPTYEAYQS